MGIGFFFVFGLLYSQSFFNTCTIEDHFFSNVEKSLAHQLVFEFVLQEIGRKLYSLFVYMDYAGNYFLCEEVDRVDDVLCRGAFYLIETAESHFDCRCDFHGIEAGF